MTNKRNVTSTVTKFALWLIIMFLAFWFSLPALNLKSGDFWSFLIFGVISFVVINAFSYVKNALKGIKIQSNTVRYEGEKFSFKKLGKPFLIALLIVVAIILFSLIMNLVGAKIFNSKNYKNLINITDSSFSEDVSEIKMSQIPVVDRDTSSALGKRKLGEMSDLVSQFEIAENYTQINYKNVPTRITPLAYGDAIKWFNNRSEGIPGYIRIDMTTQEASLVRLQEGIKYSESEYFMRNINRYLRFKYPTKIFDNLSFEIDENGTPYWVASTVKFRIGFWSGRDIGGAVLVNAVTGESKYYDFNDIPQWVDQVYNSEMVISHLNYNGKYRNGFWNSIFGQRGVLATTEGYNYLAIDDDVWLYTGMTSVSGDESNVGFVLVNLRTKEAKFYSIPGAEEYSAMSSAEGQVQEKNYSATFPILLNVSDRPTYFMSLKDAAGLVKMYAFVDVQQYQIVGTGTSVAKAKEDYASKLQAENIETDETPKTEQTVISGTVENINSAVVSGNTKYYIILQNDSNVYTVDISVSDRLPFIKTGHKIELTADITVKTEYDEDGIENETTSYSIKGIKLN